MESNKQTFHKFLSSQIDQERCAICRQFKPNHICEICGLNVDSNSKELELTIYDKILMCSDCWINENKLSVVNDSIANEFSTLLNPNFQSLESFTEKYAVEQKESTELAMFKWTCNKCGAVNNGLNKICIGRWNNGQENTPCGNTRPEQLTEISTIAGLALQSSRTIDNSIQVRTDLFNAETTAILDLKNIIDINPEITNKPFALATELKKRFEHFQSIIFSKQQEIVEASNSQRAIQVALNDLANKLRSEEREKLKISDINYKPNDVKKISVPKIKVAKIKLDKTELSKYAKELGVPEFTLAAFVTAKNCSIEVAANMIRQSLGK